MQRTTGERHELGSLSQSSLWQSTVQVTKVRSLTFSAISSYDLVRITPAPMLLRRRSGYFSRAFFACSLVLNGLDNGVNSRPTYSKSNHRSVVLDISDL